jgi:phosphotransferase system HPr-like phosphotransfer protein
MALVLADRVRETTTTVGTGSVTLAGALTGYQTFSAAVGNSNTTYYVIAGQGTSEWEVGIGTYASAGNTLARTTVLASSNAGSLVTFSAGTKDVWVDYAAGKAVTTDTLAYPPAIGGTTPAAGTFTTLTATGQTSLGGAAGSEGLRVNTVSSAINYVAIQGDTSISPKISSAGAGADLNLLLSSKGVGGIGFYSNGFAQQQFLVSHTASAVNYIQATGSTTGQNVVLSAQGSDTDVWFTLQSKNAAGVVLKTGGTGGGFFAQNSSGATQFNVANTTSAVNYLQATGGATGNSATLSAQGSDPYVSLVLQAKSNYVAFLTRSGATNSFRIIDSVSTANWLQVAGTSTGIGLSLAAAGSDTNISQVFQSKGTGAIDLAAGSSGINISNGGTVTAVTVTNGGNYTTYPSATVSAPTTAGGTTAVLSITSVYANTATVAVGGTGYTLNDTLTVVGGTTIDSAVQFQVTGVSGGVVTTVSRTTNSRYSALPSSPSTTTGGTGTGCTLNVTFYSPQISITTAGAGYVEQPTITFSGTGTSAAAYATVGSIPTIKSIGSAVYFNTSCGTGFGVEDAGTTSAQWWKAIGGAFTGILRSTGSTQDGLIQTSGTGGISLQTSSGAQTQFKASYTASAVNYLQATGATTTNGPVLSAQGSDTNIDVNVTTKGSGSVYLKNGNGTLARFNDLAAAITAYPNFSASQYDRVYYGAEGSGTNIALQYTTKGTSSHVFATTYSGLQQFAISHTASSVNYVNVTGAATGPAYGLGPVISSQGSDADIGLGFSTKGAGSMRWWSSSGFSFTGGLSIGNGQNQFVIGSSATSSTGNYFSFSGAQSAGNGPFVQPGGVDSNTDLRFGSLGTGSLRFFSGNINGGAAYEQLRVANTTSAVNYLQATGSATGAGVTFSSQGSDATVNINYWAKGSGAHILATGASYTQQATVLHTASAVNQLTLTGAITGAGPILASFGSDTNIDMNLTTKGTGSVNFNTTTGVGFKVWDAGSASTGYWGAFGGGTAAQPRLTATTSSNAWLQTSATGSLVFGTNGGSGYGTVQALVSHTASAVNYIQATGSATGSGVTLSAQGSDTNIDINLVPKGTGTTVYTGGVTINGTLTAQNEVLKGTGQNLFLQSSNLASGNWNATNNITVTGGQTDPFSGTTASLLTDNATSGGHFIYQGVTAYSNITTISVYAKAGAANGGTANNFIALAYSSTVGACFNLTTGAVVSAGLSAPISTSATNTGLPAGWWRFSITVSTNTAFIDIQMSNGTTLNYAGTGSTVYVSSPQFEFGSTLNTYVPTTTTAVYGTPTLSFSGVAGIGLQSDGSLYVSPAGTGALQAQATTSTATGGNARGANAVDWQTTRGSANQVASNISSVVVGGYGNRAAGYASAVTGGFQNQAIGVEAFIGAGLTNQAQGDYSTVVSGKSNIAGGFFNFIGSGFTNTGTSNSSVTTQSGTMNGTTAVTLSGSNASIKVGQYITGTSIAGDTYVAAVSGTSLTLSQAASGSSTSTLTFWTPHGVVVGGGNNQATGSYSFIGGGGDAGTAANRNVASGDWSAVVGGYTNSISSAGFGSAILGGTRNSITNSQAVICGGDLSTASGYNSFIGGGYFNTTSGALSTILGGSGGSTRSIYGAFNYAATYNATRGDSQIGIYVLSKASTTDATPTVLTTNFASPSGSNQVILPNNAAYHFKGSVIANVTGAANGAAWRIEGAIMRGANAASTVLIGTPTVDRIGTTAGAAAWVVTATADTTNGGLAVTVTGAASTTIRWVAKLETTEVTF